jgi:hypothetical protein
VSAGTAIPAEGHYGGLKSLGMLDDALSSAQMSVGALAFSSNTAPARYRNTPLQDAVVGLILPTISVAAAIRELLSQAYVPAARILMRPLWERTAIVDYIVTQPDGLTRWLSGKQPSLLQLLKLIFADDDPNGEMSRMSVREFHSVIHADPRALRKFLSIDIEGFVYSAGRTYGLDEIVEGISVSTCCAVTLLESNLKLAFRCRETASSR